VELHALARQAGDDFAGALATAGVTLEYADAARPGTDGGHASQASDGEGGDGGDGVDLLVRGDALLLRQALGNLLDNAIGFSPRGGVVRIALWRSANEVGIDVCDQGPGVPAYAADRLFERFYSLPRPGGGKSTGLGLPFVREVAALHGGTVSVASAPGGGCCARLVLPLPLAL
jgi:two-component system sensor histidine kinase CreC